MIRYSLKCAGGHGFESWFPSSQSYEDQRRRGFVACPECGSIQVEKAVMAPAIARTDVVARTDTKMESPSADAPREAASPVALVPEGAHEFRALLKQLRDHVTKTSDYVGDDFADLARKMHEGEIEHRSIYGEATPEEVKALRDDEVEVFPLPVLPEDRN